MRKEEHLERLITQLHELMRTEWGPIITKDWWTWVRDPQCEQHKKILAKIDQADLLHVWNNKLLMPTDPVHSDITFNDYIAERIDKTISRREAIMFHHFFITNCVVLIAGTDDYHVRLWDQKLDYAEWESMPKKNLIKRLQTKSMICMELPKERKMGDPKPLKKKVTHTYASFLEKPEINQRFHTYLGKDFTNDEKNGVFPAWHIHKFNTVDEVNTDIIQPFLDHVFVVICNRNQRLYEVEMKKNAWMFQNPLYHMGWATVLICEQGCGKNRYTDILCALWGQFMVHMMAMIPRS